MPDQHPSPAAATPAASAAALAQQLAAAAMQLQRIEQQYLCAQAEIDNIRSLTQRQQVQMRQLAIDVFAAALLPVKDRLEAVLGAQQSSCADLKHGVALTLQQVAAAFSQHRLLPLRPQPGARFDPAQHQAVALVAAEQPVNTVVSTLQCGYLIADRLLRPALVTVAQAGATSAAAADATAPPVAGAAA